MKTIAYTVAVILIAATLSPGRTPLAADAKAGGDVFSKKCASCHGAQGEGKESVAKMLKADMKPLGSKDVQAKSDADLAKVVKEGSGKMKPVSGVTDKDIQDVVAFLRTLKK